MAPSCKPGILLGRGKRRRSEGSERAGRRARARDCSGEAEAAHAKEWFSEQSGGAASARNGVGVEAPAEGPSGGTRGGVPVAAGGGLAVPAGALEEMLECPVCFERMAAPIFQCASGHIVCSGCKPRMKKQCPTCRLKMGNIRNLALEQLAASMQQPCKYQGQGCTEVPTYQTKEAHEAQCRYRPYVCPAGEGCNVTGSVAFLVQHLRRDHGASITRKASFTDQLLDSGGNFTWTPVVLSCDGHVFCVNVMATKREAADVYVALLQCLGEEDEAQDFSYRISIEKKNNRLTWEGTPASARRSHDDLLEIGEYFSVPRLMESLVKEAEDGVSFTLKYRVRRRR